MTKPAFMRRPWRITPCPAIHGWAFLAKIPILFENIIWIDDDFLNDENIEFDFEAFDIIDSGEIYINPKHFSVLDLVGALQRKSVCRKMQSRD